MELEYADDDEGNPRENEISRLDQTASAFLSQIASPLESIHLSGLLAAEKTFQALLDHHGPSLSKLSLASADSWTKLVITVDRIQRIRTHCPNLRDLRIPILYTSGGTREAELYQALGDFPCLTDVSVLLQLATEPNILPPSDLALVRDMLVSLFVNDDLARDILITIVKAGASSLQRLDVKLEAATTPRKLDDITDLMPRNWKALRIPGASENDIDAIVQVTYAENRKHHSIFD